MVLDTHILIWMANQDKLPDAIEEKIHSCSRLMISAITSWEIFMLEKYKKVTFSIASAPWLARALALHNIETIPISIPICHKANRLQWSHRDPADRFIVATSLQTGYPLATADETILKSKLVDCV